MFVCFTKLPQLIKLFLKKKITFTFQSSARDFKNGIPSYLAAMLPFTIWLRFTMALTCTHLHLGQKHGFFTE